MKITRIDFQQNWNNKLLCDVFTTVRPSTIKVTNGSRYAIYLRDVFFCYADVLDVETMTLGEIISRNHHLTDTGKDEKFFTELMHNFYHKKTWWKENDSVMNIIYFKKITQTNLFDPLP